jgi:predicted RNase H-like HicB family nuclease
MLVLMRIPIESGHPYFRKEVNFREACGKMNIVMSVRNSGYIVVTFKFRREGNKWTAVCEELETSTFGRSIPEAHKKLKEAVFLHLNTLEEVGELERFFKEHNISFHSHKPKKSEIKISGPLDTDTYVRAYIYPIQKEVRNI